MDSLLQWAKRLFGAALAKEERSIIDSWILTLAHRAAIQLHGLHEMPLRIRRQTERGEVQRNGSMDLGQHGFRRRAQRPLKRLARRS